MMILYQYLILIRLKWVKIEQKFQEALENLRAFDCPKT